MMTCSSVENERVLDKIVKATDRKDYDAALAAFHSALEPDTQVYRAIIRCAIAAGQLDEGMQLFKLMKKSQVEPDAFVYAEVVEILGKKGCHKEAHELSRRLSAKDPKLGEDPAFVMGMMTADAECKDVSCAEDHMKLVEDAVGYEPEHAHYELLLTAYKHAADGEGAISCLDRMRRAGIKPNIADFTEALGACRRELLAIRAGSKTPTYLPDETKEHDYVASITTRMAEDRVEPDIHFMEERIALCLGVARLADAPPAHAEHGVRSSNFPLALKLIEQAKSIKGGLTPALKKLLRELKSRQKPGSHAPDSEVVVGGIKDRGRSAH